MPDLVGRTVGKYRIVARLGQGGMAEVYKAYQPGLDRYVAIKVMHPFLANDADFIGRFEREARSVANLRHQNIVHVFDFDVEENLYYMAMELVDGPSLKEELLARQKQNNPFSLPEIGRLMVALADAIDYAHSQGMVHRDLKPGNFMLSRAGQVLIMDFGIAKIMGSTQYTVTGAVTGTPAYMSPEQGQGERGDERSDIYSLGIVLYEMVIGQVPFDADTPFAAIMKHITEPLPIPSATRPDLPEAIESLILKALSKNPDDRYQTGAEFAMALREGFSLNTSDSLFRHPLSITHTATPATAELQPNDPTFTQAAQEAVVTIPSSSTAAGTETVLSPTPVKKTSPWGWIVGFIVLALLVGGGYFIFDGYQANVTATAQADLALLEAKNADSTATSEAATSEVATNEAITNEAATNEAGTVTAATAQAATAETATAEAEQANASNKATPTMTTKAESIAQSPTATPTPTETAIPTETPNALATQRALNTAIAATATAEAEALAAALAPTETAQAEFLAATAIAEAEAELATATSQALATVQAQETASAVDTVTAEVQAATASAQARAVADLATTTAQAVANSATQTAKAVAALPPPATNTPAPPTNTPLPPPTSTPEPSTVNIQGKIAVPLDNGQGFYDVHIFEAQTGQRLAKIPNVRQPDFRADGRKLVVNAQGGGQNDVWEVDANSGNLERAVSGSPSDNHPVYNPGGNRIAYGNDNLAIGADGSNHPFIFVQCGVRRPQEEGDQNCNDVARFGVLVPNGQIGEIHGSSPIWAANDHLVYRGCNTWQGGNSCGLFMVPSWATKRDSNGVTPAKLGGVDGTNTIPTDSAGNNIVFHDLVDGNWELYLTTTGGGKTNLSNSPTSQDGLGTFSPDGTQIAFVSNRGGAWAVWVLPTSGGEAQKLFDLPGSPWGTGSRDWTLERISWGSN